MDFWLIEIGKIEKLAEQNKDDQAKPNPPIDVLYLKARETHYNNMKNKYMPNRGNKLNEITQIAIELQRVIQRMIDLRSEINTISKEIEKRSKVQNILKLNDGDL
ncbi:hypothetical protein RF11_05668 [Thelohanellus kitauei]|uniref:Uncharacterized protein n=1 Tax=Thelohanellus kitauei TaxID=669202 RepID=A0A0C2NBS2_THEKT|nr:hypothetical protein RF11_05668 [Thelohanellus kitauei]